MQKVMSLFPGWRIVILITALVTAVVHLSLVFITPGFLGVMFLLNCLGYLGLAGLFLLPLDFVRPYHEIVRWVLVGYAALTIILWVVINGHPDVGGVIAKLDEVLLIVALILERGQK